MGANLQRMPLLNMDFSNLYFFFVISSHCQVPSGFDLIILKL